jgi:hypothetical protein
MRSVESDIVDLNQDLFLAQQEANLALKSRFPNAMRWLIGGRVPNTLFGDQISAIIKGEKFEEFDGEQLPGESDAMEIRAMMRFLVENWANAGRPRKIGADDWTVIFKALRWCAEEIGYLPKSVELERLRENALKLSGKLVANGHVRHTYAVEKYNSHSISMHDYDWIAILRACQYTIENIPTDNPKMAEVKKKLEDMTPDLLERIKYNEHTKLTNYGYKEIDIHKSINAIILEPWKHLEDHEALRKRYWELRKLQGDQQQNNDDRIRVLRFVIKEGAISKIYDNKGNFLKEHIAGLGHSYRSSEFEPQFNSQVFVFGANRSNREVVDIMDVEIYESEIVYSEVYDVPMFYDYIYANYEVKKYQRKPKPTL